MMLHLHSQSCKSYESLMLNGKFVNPLDLLVPLSRPNPKFSRSSVTVLMHFSGRCWMLEVIIFYLNEPKALFALTVKNAKLRHFSFNWLLVLLLLSLGLRYGKRKWCQFSIPLFVDVYPAV